MKFNLQARYSLVMLAVIITIVVSLSVVLLLQFRVSTREITQLSAASLEQDLLQQVEQRGTLTATFLAENLANSLYRYDMQSMLEFTRSATEQNDLLYATIHDTDGRVVHDGTVEIASFGTALPAITRLDGVRIDAETLEVYRPILYRNQAIGGVRVGLSLAPIKEEIAAMTAGVRNVSDRRLRNNLLSAIVTSLLFAVAGMLVAFVVSRSLARPIRQLAEQATRIGSGDYTDTLAVDRSDEIGELASAFRDMSRSLRASDGEVRYLAYHDSLTRLPNRARLKQFLAEAVARTRRGGQKMALFFIDLDDFKRVNDTLGHKAGDVLLKEFSQRLRDSLREMDHIDPDAEVERDLIARLGGDEFTVVLEDVEDTRDIAVVAQRILDALHDPFLLAGQEVVVGASIGITVFPDDGETVDSLLKNADVAMFQAKDKGKNHFQFYNQSMDHAAVQRLTLENDLRHALARNELRVAYQPVIDAQTGAVVGCEALARWHHSSYGMIPTDVFLPLAEESGLIVEFDEWCLRQAAQDLTQLHATGFRNLYATVNIASVHFREQRIGETVGAVLRENDLPARCLRLELTEKTIMRNTRRAAELLVQLQALDIGVWIDNFGAGFSSLTHLTKLPIAGLKIDQEFVHRISRGANDRTVIATIIAMGHSLGMLVSADGIEDQEQLEYVRKAGCDMVQGHYFARPMGLSELMGLLGRRAPYGAGKVAATRLATT
ncbi:MAG: EAL domain-containing protein [Gammaproteobacteria bacterium]|nr:EAL domain-containing protein [Gammaproteobacteria bacterium]